MELLILSLRYKVFRKFILELVCKPTILSQQKAYADN